METKSKVEKFNKMLADAEKRNEAMIVKLLTEIKPSIEGQITVVKFDEVLFAKIQALVISASTHLKKKEQSLAEQEIYFISLLSHCFFENQIKVSIDRSKVKIDDQRVV